MAFNKVINSESQKFEPVTTETLVLDAVPTVNSFNSVTSDAVARAVAGASGEVPQVTENDNGKVLTAIYDEGGAAVEWSEAQGGDVDQTYDATSTNAQSGVAVAEAIASIPAPSVDEVPDVGSTDDGKVLTASYSGGQGSYSWQTAQGGGGASYTASAPIAIESDVIKLKYTNNFETNWKWLPERVTDYDVVTPDMSTSGIVTKCQVSETEPPYVSFFTNFYPFVLTVDGSLSKNAYIPSSVTTNKWTIVLYKQGSPTTDYAIATETYAYARVSGNNYYMFDGVTSSFTFSFNSANIHGNLSNTPLCLAFIPDPADNITGSGYWNTPTANLSNAGWQRFYTPTGPVIFSIAPTPGPTPKDTLSIVSMPDTVVDQTFNATSQKAQSGKAVAGALATVIPAYSSADSGRVLQVQADGTLAWVTLS